MGSQPKMRTPPGMPPQAIQTGGNLLLLLQFLVFLLVLPQFCTSAVSTPSLQGCAGWIFPVIQGRKKGEGEEMQSREQEEPGPPRLLGVTIALSDLNISH